jgi:multiple sugar transport system permease protein
MRIYAERAVDSSLIEAARLDGAGEWRIFRSIGFRMLAPGMVTVMLFAFVQTWNNYLLPLLMLSESKWYPLTIGLTQIGNAGAIIGSLIAIIPMILAFVLLQRFWQTGLAAGID